MIAINAHFDGKVIVPDEPVDLLPNQALVVRIEPVQQTESQKGVPFLTWLAQNAIDNPLLPKDLAHQHDHYLHGKPKKETGLRFRR